MSSHDQPTPPPSEPAPTESIPVRIGDQTYFRLSHPLKEWKPHIDLSDVEPSEPARETAALEEIVRQAREEHGYSRPFVAGYDPNDSRGALITKAEQQLSALRARAGKAQDGTDLLPSDANKRVMIQDGCECCGTTVALRDLEMSECGTILHCEKGHEIVVDYWSPTERAAFFGRASQPDQPADARIEACADDIDELVIDYQLGGRDEVERILRKHFAAIPRAEVRLPEREALIDALNAAWRGHHGMTGRQTFLNGLDGALADAVLAELRRASGMSAEGEKT